jgi:hypothetical protein
LAEVSYDNEKKLMLHKQLWWCFSEVPKEKKNILREADT